MRPGMKSLWGRQVVLALLLVLTVSFTFGCTSSNPKQYQLGFLSTSPRLSKTGCLIEHDFFGGKRQSLVAKEDWETD